MSTSTSAISRSITSQHFAVLATTGTDGTSDSAGVSYGAAWEQGALVLYVMTRRHLRKARDIVTHPAVSLVIPIPRRVLWFAPPATIQLHGRAELRDGDDSDGARVFGTFVVGRRILRSYAEMRRRGERRICFIRIVVDPVARSYMVGTSLLGAMRHMESAAAVVTLSGPTGPGRAM